MRITSVFLFLVIIKYTCNNRIIENLKGCFNSQTEVFIFTNLKEQLECALERLGKLYKRNFYPY